MMKKEYEKPEMEVIELNCQNELLSMSDHEKMPDNAGEDEMY